ncbi:MAG: MBL fold metallo-hydrolase [Cyanobacteria bacterium P01_F01_bin.116]
MDDKVYLRSDIYFEPLFNKWFMWPYLMAPATAAMNLSNHHLKLMKSFVANAKIHAKTAKNKVLSGSSMVNIPVERVGEVKQLLDTTKSDYADLLLFSEAVKELEQLLQQEADGMSLEPFYDKIPEPLRGLVELHYDLNNQPSFRFIEGLLYLSSYYKPQAQSVCLGNLMSSDRPFVLSTPRLPDDNHLHITVPFADQFVDTLFRMRDQAHSLSEVKALLGNLPCEGGLALEDIFTSERPSRYVPYTEEDVKITYLGHAGLMVESKDTVLMVDPVIAYSNDDIEEKVIFADLPAQIDYVMVTHTHMDHVCLETLIQLRHKIKHIIVPKNNSGVLADPSIKLMLKALGFTSVTELEDMETVHFADGVITALPFLGEHADLNIRSKAAWLLNVKGKKILAGADSSNLDEHLFRNIHSIVGDVDVLFIGMECTGGPLKWLYGPLLTLPISHEQNHSRRFNGADFKAASYMAKTFNADQVYIYALGVEPWFGYFMGISYNDDDIQLVESQKLVDECLSRQLLSERLCGKKVITLTVEDHSEMLETC